MGLNISFRSYFLIDILVILYYSILHVVDFSYLYKNGELEFMKKKILSVTLSLGLMTSALTPFAYAAETAELTDIKDHWAVKAIEWGIEKGAISGYKEDNTFRPENTITEAEFMSMFIRLFETLEKAEEGEPWSNPVYAFSKQYNYPVFGLDDVEKRNQPILRSTVAEIISGADGYNFAGDDAIEYVLKSGYSKGKSGATIEGYQGKDPLTRAEAIQFIKTLSEHEFTELHKRPLEVMPLDVLTYGDRLLPVAKEVKSLMPDFDYEIKKDRIVFTKNGEEVAEHVWYGYYGMMNYIYLQKYSDADSRKLVVQFLKSSGYGIGDDFEKSMIKAYEERELDLQVGDLTFNLYQGDVIDELLIYINE